MRFILHHSTHALQDRSIQSVADELKTELSKLSENLSVGSQCLLDSVEGGIDAIDFELDRPRVLHVVLLSGLKDLTLISSLKKMRQLPVIIWSDYGMEASELPNQELCIDIYIKYIGDTFIPSGALTKEEICKSSFSAEIQPVNIREMKPFSESVTLRLRYLASKIHANSPKVKELSIDGKYRLKPSIIYRGRARSDGEIIDSEWQRRRKLLIQDAQNEKSDSAKESTICPIEVEDGVRQEVKRFADDYTRDSKKQTQGCEERIPSRGFSFWHMVEPTQLAIAGAAIAAGVAIACIRK